MDRRSFLKTIGAASLLPALPAPAFATAATSATPVVSVHTYQWAEMIVRAHNKCNLGMLQRLLQLDNASAAVVKNKLLENGVISAQSNAYGMHTAIKPLYEGAFTNVSEAAKSTIEKTADFATEETKESNLLGETDSENNNLDHKGESDFEAAEPEFNEGEIKRESENNSTCKS
ncbi:MAG: hypothetical protein AAF412_10270 [Pseudomonadota bacterium]